jgi:hypothetical protein
VEFAFKSVHVCFPESKEMTELFFRKEDHKSVTVIYQFLMKNGAHIVDFDGFEHWEIKLLMDSKAPTGELLFLGDKCCSPKNKEGDVQTFLVDPIPKCSGL